MLSVCSLNIYQTQKEGIISTKTDDMLFVFTSSKFDKDLGLRVTREENIVLIYLRRGLNTPIVVNSFSLINLIHK